MNYKYEVSATLSEKSPTYVRRQADNQLYDSLKASQFCYVFNARKTGKSSLRVQVMSRLKAAGVACSIIDISSKNTQKTTLEQWYAGILNDITKDFDLNVNLRNWIKERNWLSPLEQFREFIESILLKELSENIVIFIDEIDSVLSLNFQSDDFFAFIRACYNRRVDIPEYNRLTFCLLGVATPSDLIADKKRTPFNIGQAIELTGFTLKEAKSSLIEGLVPKVDNPEAVLKEVLEWTQGQPFLTQKLCKLVIEQAESKQPNIEQIVQKYIIENWQSQDEPEHLKTICNRLTSNEQRAGRLLELYQQILLKGSVTADDSSEQGTMLLSGLVVKQEGKLKVYNRVYQCVFNLDWVERELAKLRPYTEALKAWIDSNCTDESRLLRGEALSNALTWAENKSLGLSDYQFFRDSQALEKQEIQRVRELESLESEINLKAERKKLEAQDKANKILKAANLKAKRQVRIGSIILTFSLIIAILAGIWARNTITEAQQAIRLEQEGVNATQLFESQEIKPLLLAMQAGQELQEVLNSGRSLKEYPASSPQFALKIILDNINEQNQLKGHTKGIRSANFSDDGKYIVTVSWDYTARVWDFSGKPLAVLRHNGAVLSASFNHDGQRIVTASNDNTARVWDISGKQLAVLRHNGAVLNVSFNHDGQRIVTASRDTTARVWDIFGKQLALLKHDSAVLSANFSTDGQRIVTASNDETARVWDISGKQLAVLNGHTGAVLSANFSQNGQYIVTASEDKTAGVWDISGKQLAILTGHTEQINSASLSKDGRHIVTASKDKTARVWDISGKQIAQLKGHTGAVLSASFSPNGQHIVTASSDNTARVWDISGKQLAQLKGHSNVIWSASFSPNGQHILTASDDNTARLWDIKDKQLAQLTGHTDKVKSIDFSHDGQYIVTASFDNTARVWNLSGNLLAVLKGHTNKVNSANFSLDGKRIVTASDDNTARVWDIFGKQLAVLKGHTGIVNSANFSLDGKRIVTASDDNTARVWDISGVETVLIASLQGHTDIVLSANFSPDGQRIVTASFDDTARVWDIYGNKLARLKGHTHGVISAIFSPNGRRIVTASRDNTARLWDISGKQLAVLNGHTDIVRSASFSLDGQRVVTASFDNTARIWDISGVETVLTRSLQGHINTVSSASFSPNGQRVVTASDDNTARVWDISGKQLALLKGHISKVNSASFSPDGRRIITASDDNTARLWQVEDLNQLLVRGCKWLNNYLITHPAYLEKLKVCQNQNKDNLIEAAPFMVIEGEEQARKGNIDDAVASFIQALKWNSKLNFDPKAKAKQIASASKLVDNGNDLVQEGNIEGAITMFQKALQLDPNLIYIQPKTKAAELLLLKAEELVSEDKIKEAILAYAQVQKLQPKVEISPYSWDDLCRAGILQGYAANVMYACNKAVLLAPDDEDIIDNRGIARVLTGNTSGAIEDFQVFIDNTDDRERQLQRQRWIDVLQAGKKPFTVEELKKLL